ncbi:hypothetical protein DMA11_21040, partial [Marinilabiliaceae bacterium JC017]
MIRYAAKKAVNNPSFLFIYYIQVYNLILQPMNNNQTIQRRQTLTVSACTLALSLCLVTGCRAQNISDEERQWLIDKTKEDLVFVEGGTFLMGDVGYIDQNGREQLFSGDPETLPVHKVTLDSYSMQRYEVSIKEFDIYTKAIGEDRI